MVLGIRSRKQNRKHRKSSLTPIPEDECCQSKAARKRSAPKSKTGTCRNSHVFVNQERIKRCLPVLVRCRDLEALAKRRAELMADRKVVTHSVGNITDLQRMLSREDVGENVQRGGSVASMHIATMDMRSDPANRRNILSRHFTEFGTGAAKGADGNVYLCQLFRGA